MTHILLQHDFKDNSTKGAAAIPKIHSFSTQTIQPLVYTFPKIVHKKRQWKSKITFTNIFAYETDSFGH